MAEPKDMILPLLQEMRAEMVTRFDRVDGRFDTVDRRLKSLEAAHATFKQALGADSLLSRLVTGEFEERIEALERKIEELAGTKVTATSEALNELSINVRERFGEKLADATFSYGELTFSLQPDAIVEVLEFLKADPRCRFVSIIDICGVDYPSREKRFDVVYHLLSPYKNLRVRLKLQTDEDTPVPSVTSVYPGADWFEREAYDLYGILFTGHPDLRRLLTDYGFEGYPLRKDFPLTGFVEVRYDDEAKRVVYEPVELRQEFRNFDFLSPWEGTDYVLPGDEKAKQ